MTPKHELEQRITRLQNEMKDAGIDGTIIVQRADLFYFSGTGQNCHLFVPAEGDPVLIVKKSMARAEQESKLEKIIPFNGWDTLLETVKIILPENSKLGIESDVLPASLYFRYQKTFSVFELVDISKIIRRIRAVKSDYEIGIMKEAALISESVFKKAGSIIREGLKEVELAGRLEQHARSMGHQGIVRMRGFNQELYYGHIMTGENAAAISFFDGPTGGSGLNPSFPQGAGTTVIKKNEPILVDFVSVLGGYMVDQTRIFSIGDLPFHLEKAYNEAVTIKKKLSENGKPGVMASSLYDQAKKIAIEAGLDNHFMGYVEKVSFIGHGVGLELDELPVIARGVDILLEKGAVFALEPKFIFPGEGTVGIEDTFVVGDNSLEQLTIFSDQLQVV
ncbi:MAG: M24 family metallopeptidase [Bacillota bacterium]